MVGMEGLLQAKQVAKAELVAAIKSNAHLEIIRALTLLFDDAAAELREAQGRQQPAIPPPPAPDPRLQAIPEEVAMLRIEQTRRDKDFEKRLTNIEAKVAARRQRSSISYAQYYELMDVKTRDVNQILGQFKRASPIPPEPEQQPDHNAAEDTVITPWLMQAFADLPDAEQSTDEASKAPSTSKGEKGKATRISPVRVGQYEVHDTRAGSTDMQKLKPDISIVRVGFPPSGFNTVSIIEVQKGALDNAHRGKALRYGEVLLEENPERPFVFVFLTNTHCLEVFNVIRTSTEFTHQRSNTLNVFGDEGRGGWGILASLCQQDPRWFGHKVPLMRVDDQILSPVAVLGSGRTATVYDVDKGRACKVFKGAQMQATELAILKHLASLKPKSTLFPIHCGDGSPRDNADDACWVVLTKPILQTLDFLVAKDLADLLDGLRWLHTTAKLVLRDFEPKHIGRDPSTQRIGIFDMGSAVHLPSGHGAQSVIPDEAGGDTTRYSGTLMYASDDVLNAISGGQSCPPHVRQDLVPLVKSVYTIVHPAAERELGWLRDRIWSGLSKSSEVAACVQKVKAFWKQELDIATPAGKHWSGLVELAHAVRAPSSEEVAPGSEEVATSYEAVMGKLYMGIAPHLRARAMVAT